MAHQVKSRNADALRAFGYEKVPSWWLTLEQMEMIRWMAEKNLPDIARIKEATQRRNEVKAAQKKHNGEKNE